MPVLMLVAAVVILAGVVVVASGRGGELAATEPDYPPIDLGPVTSADVALLRPPSAAWGYNMRVTDEALEVIAKAVTERDVQIAALQQEVSDLRDQLGEGGRAATLDRPGGSPADETADGTAEAPADGTADGTAGEPAEGPAGGQEPAGPQIPEPDWPRHAEDPEAAGPAVPITRPQPIYHAEGRDEGPGLSEADQPGAPAGATSLPVTPATGWRVQEPLVGDEASRPAGQEQTRAPGPEQAQAQAQAARPRDAHEFSWDEDPHQRVVWGAGHARAKAAKATEETLPNAERRDEDRG